MSEEYGKLKTEAWEMRAEVENIEMRMRKEENKDSEDPLSSDQIQVDLEGQES